MLQVGDNFIFSPLDKSIFTGLQSFNQLPITNYQFICFDSDWYNLDVVTFVAFHQVLVVQIVT